MSGLALSRYSGAVLTGSNAYYIMAHNVGHDVGRMVIALLKVTSNATES